MFYKAILKPLFFALDPENAHDIMRSLGGVANFPLIERVAGVLFKVKDARLETSVAGMRFPNPIGLAAGFDKNAELMGLFSALGFGFLELGTVTALAQPGNARPRIFRLPKDEALINRMGFPSHGADAVAKRLEATVSLPMDLPILGINIGKSKEVDLDKAIDDYCASFQKLARFASYVAINVSSPNTQGLRQLQERERLSALLEALAKLNVNHRPIFVKVAPDLTWEQLDEVLECCDEQKVAGLIATNTTLSREGLAVPLDEQGGLSGKPLRERALSVVRYASKRLEGRLSIIGVGGISTVASVLDMLGAGADAVQVYTGLIYEGPSLVAELNRGLLSVMESRGCASLVELRVMLRNTTR